MRITCRPKLGRWDGTVRFCDVGGRTYLNLLDDILPIVIEAGYEIDIEDKREHSVLEFDEVTEEFWGDTVWPKDIRQKVNQFVCVIIK